MVIEMLKKSDKRNNVSGYVEYVYTLKQLIREHSTKSHGGRRQRKRWWDGEVQAAIQLRQVVNRQHSFALNTESSHEVAEKWKMHQKEKKRHQTTGTAETPVIMDERTGFEVDTLDQCITEHLMKVFAPQETTPR